MLSIIADTVTVIVTFTMLILTPVVVVAQTELDKTTKTTASTNTTNSAESQLSQTLQAVESQLQQMSETSNQPQARSRQRQKLQKSIPDSTQTLQSLKQQLITLDKQVLANFKQIESELLKRQLPQVILDRHRQTVDRYRTEINQLLNELDNVTSAKSDTDRLNKVQKVINHLKTKQNKPTHQQLDPKHLPFQASENKARPPKETPEELEQLIQIDKPIQVAVLELTGAMLAQANPSLTPNDADLLPTEDVQITEEIKALAEQLEHHPVKIFNWVRNNIEYLPTYGSIQGSQMTLDNLRGNAFDTASLLIALLRASNIPARYAYGTVQIPIEKVMNWVGGVESEIAALELMLQGGIPASGLAEGGVIKFAKMEHIWVEAWVDFFPSRGAKNKIGDSWIPMDGSFKQYTKIPSIMPENFTTGIENAVGNYYQSATHSDDGSWSTGYDTNLLSEKINSAQAIMANIITANPEKITLDEYIGGRKISAFEPPMLASSLPYQILARIDQWAKLPSNLRITANIELLASGLYGYDGSTLLSKNISLASLGYGSLNLTHVAATEDDAAVWNSYKDSGALEFPPYLVNVKSQLKINGTIVAESGGIGIGGDLVLKITFSGAGYNKSAKFHIIAGDEIEIGINGAGQSPRLGTSLKDRDDLGTASGNLYAANKVFWTQLDFQDQLLAKMQGVVVSRLPSVGIFASPISIVYSFGIPRRASYHSRQVDVKLSNVAVVALDGNQQTKVKFMLQSGITTSATEGAVIEEVFAKPIGHGSNTIRLLQLANEQKIPIYHLKASNLAANRSSLQHSPEVMADINNAINANLEVIIPKTQQTNGAWTGSGYMMIDPKTGAADYRVSGGLSGNFDDEDCGRSVEPVKVTVPDVSIIWSFLFGWMIDDDFNFNGEGISTALQQIAAVTALIGIITVSAPAGAVVEGSTGASILTKATFDGILYAVGATSASFAVAGEGANCSCTPRPLDRRKGPNPGTSIYADRHNICADHSAFTDFPGVDVDLRDVAFDGWKVEEKTLYEIKLGTFYSTIKKVIHRPSAKRFLEYLRYRAILGFYRERIPSGLCGFEFKYVLKDTEMLKDLKKDLNEWSNPADAGRIFDVSPQCPY